MGLVLENKFDLEREVNQIMTQIIYERAIGQLDAEQVFALGAEGKAINPWDGKQYNILGVSGPEEVIIKKDPEDEQDVEKVIKQGKDAFNKILDQITSGDVEGFLKGTEKCYNTYGYLGAVFGAGTDQVLTKLMRVSEAVGKNATLTRVLNGGRKVPSGRSLSGVVADAAKKPPKKMGWLTKMGKGAFRRWRAMSSVLLGVTLLGGAYIGTNYYTNFKEALVKAEVEDELAEIYNHITKKDYEKAAYQALTGEAIPQVWNFTVNSFRFSTFLLPPNPESTECLLYGFANGLLGFRAFKIAKGTSKIAWRVTNDLGKDFIYAKFIYVF